MTITKIDPMDYPLMIGESWWIIHPNSSEAEICIPIGAPAVCKADFADVFKKNSPYRIVNVDDHNGWVSIAAPDNTVVEMPRYVFARYFDAVAYIKDSKRRSNEEE
jgi:hypothetical protein